jgi:hypothetical protein
LTRNPKGKERESAKNTMNTKNTRNSRTHTYPIQPILTPVARWTTPIESPTEETAVEFRGERPVLEKEIGEGERVLALESHSQI